MCGVYQVDMSQRVGDTRSQNKLIEPLLIEPLYTLFYFNFIKQNSNPDCLFWSSQLNSPLHNTWAGLAFERVCLQHTEQIKYALGVSAVLSNEYSWTHKSKNENEKGVQIDLLIDRNDQVINLCEIKYATDTYTIDHEEDARLHRRLSTFLRESKTRKTVYLTMITTYGLSKGGYSDDVPCQVTMDDLFLRVENGELAAAFGQYPYFLFSFLNK